MDFAQLVIIVVLVKTIWGKFKNGMSIVGV